MAMSRPMERYQHIVQTLEAQLQRLEEKSNDPFDRYEKAIQLCSETLQLLRERVISQGFPNPSQECSFFKQIKPKVLGLLIFYLSVGDLKNKEPLSPSSLSLGFYKKQLLRTEAFFQRHRDFYAYHRRGLRHRDREFYLRSKEIIPWDMESLSGYTDPRFSTSHDLLKAKVLGYEKLIQLLQSKISPYTQAPPEAVGGSLGYLRWTGTKTELIELIYALQGSGAVNRGRAEIKELAAIFERTFHIDLGNYYHTFIEMRARKTSRTKFMDQLTEVLEHRMEAADL